MSGAVPEDAESSGLDVEVMMDVVLSQSIEKPQERSNVTVGTMGKREKKPIPDTEDLEVLWEHFTNDPDFFQAIEIDRQAGFDEIKQLHSSSRYLTAILGIAFLVLNSMTLVGNNSFLIVDYFNGKAGADVFLLTGYLYEQWFGGQFPAEVFIGCLELGVGIALLLVLFVLACRFTRSKSEAFKWRLIAQFMFWAVPTATTLSAVKLLNYVTPSVLIPSLLQEVSRLTSNGCEDRGKDLIRLIVTRVFFFFVGFDTFLFKYQILSGGFQDFLAGGENAPPASTLLINSLVFMNQMIGVVQVGWFVKQRIYLFIFAGEDGVFTEMEEAIKDTWEAMFAKYVWEELPWTEAIALYLSFSDLDFQKLALDDRKTGGTRTREPKSQKFE